MPKKVSAGGSANPNQRFACRRGCGRFVRMGDLSSSQMDRVHQALLQGNDPRVECPICLAGGVSAQQTLQCSGQCGLKLPLHSFSKNQRRRGDNAMCERCVMGIEFSSETLDKAKDQKSDQLYNQSSAASSSASAANITTAGSTTRASTTSNIPLEDLSDDEDEISTTTSTIASTTTTINASASPGEGFRSGRIPGEGDSDSD